MRIVRQNERVLVVDGATLRLALLCAALSVPLLYEGRLPAHHVLLAMGAGFFACALLTARTTRFTFDARTQTVRWRLQRLLLQQTGSLAFDSIADVITESSGSGSAARHRLALAYGDGAVPMDFSFTSDLSHLSNIRVVILKYVRPGADESAEG